MPYLARLRCSTKPHFSRCRPLIIICVGIAFYLRRGNTSTTEDNFGPPGEFAHVTAVAILAS